MKHIAVGVVTVFFLVGCSPNDEPPSAVNSPSPRQIAPAEPKISDSMLVAQAHVSMLKNEPQCEPFKIQLLNVGKGGSLGEKDTAQIVRTMAEAQTAKCTAF